MNGFIFLSGNDEEPGCGLKKTFGLQTGTVAEKSFDTGERLITWGQSAGDIHYCLTTHSLLVLCGYISEVSQGPTFVDQEQAANFLLEALTKEASNAGMGVLLDRLHGSFAIFFRDHRKALSLCLTDRMASRPLWRLWTARGWVVSSHAAAIASASPSTKIDLGALGAFLLYGGPVEPRKSLFAGIEAAPPGSIIKLNPTGCIDEYFWYRFRHEPDRQLSLSKSIDLASDRLLRTASRIVRQCPQPMVFFSGGVDSRLTAVALQAVGANPTLVTLGEARNLEVRVAERAAKAMGLRHVLLSRDKHWYLRTLPGIVPETGGSFLWTHGHFSQAVLKLGEEHGAPGFFLGDFCEAFSKLFCCVEKNRKHLWSPEQFAESFDDYRLPMYRPKNKPGTLSLLPSTIRGQVAEALRRDALGRYQSLSATADDPWIVGDLFFRWGSAATLPTFAMFLDLRRVAPERNLMFDKDVQSLLELIPSSHRNGANMGALIIKKLNPRAAFVPNSNSLLPMAWPPAAHRFSRKCKPLLGKVRRLVFGHSHRTTGSWPEKAALYPTDPKWRDFFKEMLFSDELLDGGLIDGAKVRQCWDALQNGDRQVSDDVEKLVQLSLLSKLGRGLKTPADKVGV